MTRYSLRFCTEHRPQSGSLYKTDKKMQAIFQNMLLHLRTNRHYPELPKFYSEAEMRFFAYFWSGRAPTTGDKIIQLQDENVSIAEIAERLGISVQAVYRWLPKLAKLREQRAWDPKQYQSAFNKFLDEQEIAEQLVQAYSGRAKVLEHRIGLLASGKKKSATSTKAVSGLLSSKLNPYAGLTGWGRVRYESEVSEGSEGAGGGEDNGAEE